MALIKCKYCEKEINEDSVFCPNCGNKVYKDENKCKNCNSILNVGDAFCSKCGFKVDDSPSSDTQNNGEVNDETIIDNKVEVPKNQNEEVSSDTSNQKESKEIANVPKPKPSKKTIIAFVIYAIISLIGIYILDVLFYERYSIKEIGALMIICLYFILLFLVIGIKSAKK